MHNFYQDVMSMISEFARALGVKQADSAAPQLRTRGYYLTPLDSAIDILSPTRYPSPKQHICSEVYQSMPREGPEYRAREPPVWTLIAKAK